MQQKIKVYSCTERQVESAWQRLLQRLGRALASDLVKDKVRKMRVRYKMQRWTGLAKDVVRRMALGEVG